MSRSVKKWRPARFYHSYCWHAIDAMCVKVRPHSSTHVWPTGASRHSCGWVMLALPTYPHVFVSVWIPSVDITIITIISRKRACHTLLTTYNTKDLEHESSIWSQLWIYSRLVSLNPGFSVVFLWISLQLYQVYLTAASRRTDVQLTGVERLKTWCLFVSYISVM